MADVDDTLDRRAFLMGCLGALAGCAAVPWHTIEALGEGGEVRVPGEAIGPEGYVVVGGGGMKAPILLTTTSPEPRAVELVCTHRGCAVRVRRDRLVCPCHGSEFALAGEVLQGPAAVPLKQFPVRREGGGWIIDRGRG